MSPMSCPYRDFWGVDPGVCIYIIYVVPSHDNGNSFVRMKKEDSM